jgi:hypothetical protein
MTPYFIALGVSFVIVAVAVYLRSKNQPSDNRATPKTSPQPQFQPQAETPSPAVAPTATSEPAPTATEEPAPPAENPYHDLRMLALNVTPEDLGLEFSEDVVHTYGVVMDWDRGGGVATLIAFQTGDASIYFSNGGGIMGGVQHPAVAESAKAFVADANIYLTEAEPAERAPLPDLMHIRYYFLTNAGVYSVQDVPPGTEEFGTIFEPFFAKANAVITELRKAQP